MEPERTPLGALLSALSRLRIEMCAPLSQAAVRVDGMLLSDPPDPALGGRFVSNADFLFGLTPLAEEL